MMVEDDHNLKKNVQYFEESLMYYRKVKSHWATKVTNRNCLLAVLYFCLCMTMTSSKNHFLSHVLSL